MLKVSSSQFNYIYNNSIHFPYSIALLVSYIKKFNHLNKIFKFEKTFVFREKVEEYITNCKDSDILLCSCYVWNWEITKYLAGEVKKINPDCTIVFGGPQIPNQTDHFFEKYPFVDILVHGEGEYVIKNIFEAYLKDKDYSKIQGVETKNFKNPPQPRINDLESIPSPYLTNIIWDLVEPIENLHWNASWETNRGCPYRCTFCDWGSATYTKMRKPSDVRIFKEIEWFGKNKISYIDCCDANFGIFLERDFKIAKKLTQVAKKIGFPKTFRTNWAKFSSKKIIPIAKELQKSDLFRAVTLSLQSLDETTLDIIIRENIKFETFSELTNSFSSNEIPTYSEIIMGLPGETLKSFKKGLEILASDTKIETIQIYNCMVLPNAPMNEPSYLKRFQIKKIRSPIDFAHQKIIKNEIKEYDEITVSTFSFTLDDLKEMYFFSWMIQTFHSLGILDQIAKFYNLRYGLSIMNFYETLLTFCRTKNSIFSREYDKVLVHINKGYAGKGWNHYDPKLGNMFWPIEEASWLRLVYNTDDLLNDILYFLNFLEKKHHFQNSHEILTDLVRFQIFLLSTKQSDELKSEEFNYDWKDFFVNNQKLKRIHKNYFYKNLVLEQDYLKWCQETIWFGRFRNTYKFPAHKLMELKTKVKLFQKIN